MGKAFRSWAQAFLIFIYLSESICFGPSPAWAFESYPQQEEPAPAQGPQVEIGLGQEIFRRTVFIVGMTCLRVIRTRLQEEELKGREPNPVEIAKLIKTTITDTLSTQDYWAGLLVGNAAGKATQRFLEVTWKSQGVGGTLFKSVLGILAMFATWDVISESMRVSASQQGSDSEVEKASHGIKLLADVVLHPGEQSAESKKILKDQLQALVHLLEDPEARYRILDRAWRTRIATGETVTTAVVLASSSYLAGPVVTGFPIKRFLTSSILLLNLDPSRLGEITDGIRYLRVSVNRVRLEQNGARISKILDEAEQPGADLSSTQKDLLQALSDRKEVRDQVITAFFEKAALAERDRNMLDREIHLAEISGDSEELRKSKDTLVRLERSVGESDKAFQIFLLGEVRYLSEQPELLTAPGTARFKWIFRRQAWQAQKVAELAQSLIRLASRESAVSDELREKAKQQIANYYLDGFFEAE